MAQKSERDDRSTFFDTHPTGPVGWFNEVYKEILKTIETALFLLKIRGNFMPLIYRYEI